MTPRMSLRQKILLLSMLLALVPLGFAGYSMVTVTQDELKSAVNERVVNTATEVAHAFNSAFLTWTSPLLLLRDAMDQPQLGTREKLAMLESSVIHLEDFLAIALQVEGFPSTYFLHPEFRQALRGTEFQPETLFDSTFSASEDFVIGRPRWLGEYWLLPLNLPLRQPLNGERAQIFTLVDLRGLAQWVQQHPHTRHGQIHLLDQWSDVLFASHPGTEHAYWKTHENHSSTAVHTIRFREPQGEYYLGALARVPSLPWRVAVSLAETEAYAAIRKMRRHLASWLMVGLVAAFIAAWWFARHIGKPVLAVAEVAQRVGAGDLSARVAPLRTGDEISLLGERINDMVQSLLALHASGAGTFHYHSARDRHEWDPRALEIFGWQDIPAHDGFAHWWASIDEADRTRTQEQISTAIARDRPFDVEYRIVCANRTRRYVRTQGFTVRDPTEGGRLVSGLHTDITARKEEEWELIRARENAEAANRAKSTFLANMSHDLRTPLNAILGYAQILAQDDTLADPHRTKIKVMQRSGEYLLTLINDILDLAKIEAGRFELFPSACAIGGFFHTLEDIFSLRARQKNVVFLHETLTPLPDWVECDEKRLRQVMVNLLGNALKFTEQGSVVLRTSYQAEQLHISVQDTGIGIARDQLTDIFEPFRQTGAEQYKIQGTGLGLSISLKLVTLMGGELEVDSELGQGATFFLRVPAPRLSVDATTKPRESESKVTGYRRTDGNTAPLRLLIVDDIEENRDIPRLLLEPLGFEVVVAEGGKKALEVAQQCTLDALLVDVVMPDINGLDVIRALRHHPKTQNLAMFAVSASVFPEDFDQSLTAGASAHLPKPIKTKDLFAALASFLPLAWEHGSPQTQEPTPASEQKLPLEIFTRFQTAVLRGDIKSVHAELDILESHQCCPALIQQLRDWATQFKIKELRDFLADYSPV